MTKKKRVGDYRFVPKPDVGIYTERVGEIGKPSVPRNAASGHETTTVA